MHDALVSIIIPAHNCAATISETLASACAQTHREIEIIVIDDGSRDATAQIVRQHAATDDRIRCITQGNQGVAAARNRGVAEARGELIATLDADDLWHPDKIALQVRRFEELGPATGLVYAWCCWIDEKGLIIGRAPARRWEGRIFDRVCRGDVVVSGSNALIRKAAIAAIGGFDTEMRNKGAQGCEDWKLYLQIARDHAIGLVPQYLIGYRILPGSMSDDFHQMMQSRLMVEDEFLPLHPEHEKHFAYGRAALARSIALRAFKRRQIGAALKMLVGHPTPSPAFVLRSLAWLSARSARRAKRLATRGILRRTYFHDS